MADAVTPQPALPRCLIIVPAFNEAATVGRVVGELLALRPAPVGHSAGDDRRGLSGGLSVDVLVIDDGSTDATTRCVPAGAKLVSLPFNLGIGGAMQTGYRYAARHGYDLAVQVDADGQHPPDQVGRLVAHLQHSGADLVIGSRFLPPLVEEAAAAPYRQSPPRMAGILVLRALLYLLTGRRFTDCTSGFRVANRRVINAFAHWYPDDYPEPEVVLLLHRAGFRVEEAPVRMAERAGGRSSIGLFSGLFYVVKVCASLILATIRRPWPPAKLGPPELPP